MGSGTVTPLSPGNAPVISGDGYSNAFPYTLLSLPRFAEILGLDPIQFFGGLTTYRSRQNCDDVWFQYRWQDGGKVSREEVNNAISQAEFDIANTIGYWPAPVWIANELVSYPQFNVKEYRGVTGRNATGFLHKSVKTHYGHVIQGGFRNYTQIDDADYVRNVDADIDGDGFAETAVFTVSNIDFEPCELEAYYKCYVTADAANCRTDPESTGADQYWQIRDIRIKYNSTTQQALVYIPKYQLFKPQLQRQIDASVIDADDPNSYVDTIEFYRVYNDPSTMVQFLWASEVSCTTTACAWATQIGCLRVKDRRNGLVTLSPSTYNSTTESYTDACFSQCTEPDKAILWYYAGYQDPNTRGCGKLTTWWAMTIAMLAVARLNQQICACENVARQAVQWQEDMALNVNARSFQNAADLSNPFGTRVGEIMAWRRLNSTGIKKGRAIIT